MNRTLKFRAILKKEKILRDVHGIDFLYLKVLVSISGSYEWHSYKKLIQSTGLYDKNGEEIYEGDILRLIDSEFEEGNNYVTVEWNDKMTGFDPFIDYAMFSSSPVSGIGDDPKNCEVIGNIFENPDARFIGRENKYEQNSKIQSMG